MRVLLYHGMVRWRRTHFPQLNRVNLLPPQPTPLTSLRKATPSMYSRVEPPGLRSSDAREQFHPPRSSLRSVSPPVLLGSPSLGAHVCSSDRACACVPESATHSLTWPADVSTSSAGRRSERSLRCSKPCGGAAEQLPVLVLSV